MRMPVLVFALLALPAGADTDFLRLTPTERVIFHSEIREVLLDLRHLLPGADTGQINIYADDIANDLRRIDALSDTLFDPQRKGFGSPGARHAVALFIQPDCPDCTKAENDLRTLAQTYDLQVTLINIAVDPKPAQDLDLDMSPSYVFADKLIRGYMPPIVLERYLSQ